MLLFKSQGLFLMIQNVSHSLQIPIKPTYRGQLAIDKYYLTKRESSVIITI